MTPTTSSAVPLEDSERETITRLMQNASVEITIHDVKDLAACRERLRRSTAVYVSYLPKQSWEQIQSAVLSVHDAGFEPIPHVPARQLESHEQFDDLLRRFTKDAGVRRLLLIAGDRPTPRGPFASTIEVLQTGLLANHGIRSVFVAGHPEGHPTLSEQELRAAERAKVEAAQQTGLEITFLTQFCFTATPIIEWIRQLRAHDIRVPVVAGLAGPARITALLKYAAICGVGPSLRTLRTRGSTLGQLVAERGPEAVIRALVRGAGSGAMDLAGIHFFSFGGLLRTCAWIDAAAHGQFRLVDDSFDVIQSDRSR